MSRGAAVGNIRVRLLRQAGLQPVTETFSRPEGQVRFTNLTADDYIIETFETEKLEATSTNVAVSPPDRARPRPMIVPVMIEIPLKPPPDKVAPGVVRADVDLDVPKAALKHYNAGMKALRSDDPAEAVKELRAAVEAYPKYYAARLELGRELRLEKRFQEAEEVLRPLREVEPRRAEPLIEYGIVLLELQRRKEAAGELTAALKLEEANWATHLYLGWALLEVQPDNAEPHFKRAIELDEPRAARAHIALARIADAKGMRRLAVEHLEAYLALAPNAPDAESVRKLAERLRR
jgi:tetratricopeptide (TPR) repeat protein